MSMSHLRPCACPTNTAPYAECLRCDWSQFRGNSERLGEGPTKAARIAFSARIGLTYCVITRMVPCIQVSGVANFFLLLCLKSKVDTFSRGSRSSDDTIRLAYMCSDGQETQDWLGWSGSDC